VGRGVGSGHGKTCCRGSKGLLSRKGGGLRPGFEGGQMPLIRRLPKRGFTNIFRSEYNTVNLRFLNVFKEGDVVNPAKLEEKGLIRGTLPLKILADGDLKRKLTVEAHKFSKSAVEKIKKAGGTIKVLT
jgi:large subunit ribosomal protein L15